MQAPSGEEEEHMGQKMNRLPFPLLRHAPTPRKSHILPAVGALVVIFLLYRMLDNLGSEQMHQYISTGGADPGRQHVFPPSWEVDYDAHDKHMISQIHPGIRLLDIRTPSLTNITEAQAEILFYSFIERKQVECKKLVRMGKKGDGGWDVCVSPPYAPKKPCLVYSFGISNDWSFDDDVATHMGCQVHSFDPTIDRPSFKRRDLVTFHKVGLHGFNGFTHRGRVRTLGTHIRDLGHTKNAIDYLKIDIEASEWAALEVTLREGALRNVKQLGVEIHNPETYVDDHKLGSVNREDYLRMLAVLSDLERQGFKRYKIHENPSGRYMSEHTFKQRSCCMELYYVNLNFLQT